MPELGETWSTSDAASGVRVEAVVIATGPTSIRLVDRFGRRIAFPTNSWGHVWQRARAAPVLAERCHKCGERAYFRFVAPERSVTWSCEDHIPPGLRAYFPGEAVDAGSAPALHCPACSAPDVKLLRNVDLPRRRSTTQYECDTCNARWLPLCSYGLADDGARLLEDLYQLLEDPPSEQQVRIGYTAYRSLCRAAGMGDVAHVRGVPVQVDSTLGNLVAFVFSGGPASPPSVAEEPARFGSRFEPVTLRSSSMWSNRRVLPGASTQLAVLVTANDREVQYSVAGRRPLTSTPADFRRWWSPMLTRPRTSSVWVHRTTDQLVQVLEATNTQAANDQVHYVTKAGQRETTPLRTFERLYRELPTPPEDHVWSLEGEAFKLDRDEQGLHVRPLWPRNRPLPERLDVVSLFEQCHPVESYEELGALRVGTQWINKSTPSVKVSVQDICAFGWSRAPFNYVVLQTDLGGTDLQRVDDFLRDYDYQPSLPPCQVGETWESLTAAGRSCIIRKVSVLREEATVEREDGSLDDVPHHLLVRHYRKRDSRSRWQILEADDD